MGSTTRFRSGYYPGFGIYSNATFEVQNGAITINGFMWRNDASMNGGDVYVSVTPERIRRDGPGHFLPPGDS